MALSSKETGKNQISSEASVNMQTGACTTVNGSMASLKASESRLGLTSDAMKANGYKESRLVKE